MGWFATTSYSLLLAAGLLSSFVSSSSSSSHRASHRIKRQIFREQVLPHSGGKIPEDAFRSDRLALNRLNKEGIAIPDGVLLETRHRESHFPSHRHDPDIDAAIIKLVQRPDGRYAPPEGRYPFNNLVESTYVIRPPINLHSYGGIPPRQPVQATLQLPARPFFSEDEETEGLESNIDLLNTINQDFPGTRLWTGFGPLFHETANRILRHSGSKKLSDKRIGGAMAGNHLIGSQGKQTLKPNLQTLGLIGVRTSPTSAPSTSVQPTTVLLQKSSNQQGLGSASITLAASNTMKVQQSRPTEDGLSVRPGIPDIINAAAMAQVNAAVNGEVGGGMTRAELGRKGPRTLEVVDGVLVRNRNVQPLRPGPHLHLLKTHLTAPALAYPSLQGIPKTSFACTPSTARRMLPDHQTNCQVFHLCHPDGKKESFLCPVGSRYDAKSNLCSPWTNVSCPGDT